MCPFVPAAGCCRPGSRAFHDSKNFRENLLFTDRGKPARISDRVAVTVRPVRCEPDLARGAATIGESPQSPWMHGECSFGRLAGYTGRSREVPRQDERRKVLASDSFHIMLGGLPDQAVTASLGLPECTGCVEMLWQKRPRVSETRAVNLVMTSSAQSGSARVVSGSRHIA